MFNKYNKNYTEITNNYNNHDRIKNNGRNVSGSWGGSSFDTSWTPWAQKESDDRMLANPFYVR